MPRITITDEEFIKNAINKHGNKYDYSKTKYKGYNTKTTFICDVHGEFLQTPTHHLQTIIACFKCSRNNRTTGKENFVKKAILVHGNKYNYDKVDYKTTHTKVIITCRIHGNFEQTPSGHLSGHTCKKCARNGMKTLEQFIGDAIKVHKNIYNYSKVDYKGGHTKITIICKIHGEFKQTPSDHLRESGCKKCISTRKTKEQFINDAIALHGNKYDYNNVDYETTHVKVTITCKIHGDFEQAPSGHLVGKGCRKCLYKNETMCIEHLEKLADCELTKCRPKFLNGLELDGYNEGMKLGIEYNGRQHYENIDYFHRSEKDFESQKERDHIKKELCKQNGIYLIIIPYWVKNTNSYIENEYANYEMLTSYQL
jgi:hypothetical protein